MVRTLFRNVSETIPAQPTLTPNLVSKMAKPYECNCKNEHSLVLFRLGFTIIQRRGRRGNGGSSNSLNYKMTRRGIFSTDNLKPTLPVIQACCCHNTIKVTGYSLFITFNCTCAQTTLHGL